MIAEKEVANGATATLIHYIYDDEGLSGLKVKLHSYDNVDANLKTDTNGFLFFQVTKDIFGNIVRVDSENGIALECEYDAFGNRYITNETTISDGYYSIPMSELCNIGYKGYYYDSGAKLYYTGTRYYNPETGRYLSPNKATNLQINAVNGLNLFDFYNNNPLRPIALTKGEYKTNINASIAPEPQSQLQPVPDWCNNRNIIIANTSISFTEILHISLYLRKNPQISKFATFNKWNEIPLKYSSIINKIGYGFILLDVAIDIYNNTQQGKGQTEIGFSAIYTIVANMTSLMAAKIVTKFVTKLISASSKFIYGGVAGLLVGVLIDILCLYIGENLL